MTAKSKRLPRMSKGKYNNKPVIDADRPLDIFVSKADIVGGTSGDPDDCAAAKSINRMRAVVAAHVYRSRVYVEYKDKVVRYVTPARLRQETISFDRGTPGKFMEGEYKILAPIPAQQLGAEHRTGRKGGKIKTAVEKHPVAGARHTAHGMFRAKETTT